MRLKNPVQIELAEFAVALLVGLVLGTIIGIAEGVWVLVSQGVVGRYNELLAWAIVVDACALIGVEFGFAVINELIFWTLRLDPAPAGMVCLYLGETVFAAMLGFGVWSQGVADPSPFAHNALSVLFEPAVVGLILGACVLAGSMWLIEHYSFIRRLRVRYWLVFEAAVVVVAVAFGFTH